MRLRYSPWILFGAGHLLLLGAVGLFGGLFLVVRGPGAVEPLFPVRAAPGVALPAIDVRRLWLPVAAGLVATVIAHEGLHGLAYRALGYEVTYGVSLPAGAFYAAAFGQYQAREHVIRVALAPLVTITAVATPLLVVAPAPVAVAALIALAFNAAGSIGDLLVVWRLSRLPAGTLLFDDERGASYALVPADAGPPRAAGGAGPRLPG